MSPPVFAEAEDFIDGVAQVQRREDGRWVRIEKSGKETHETEATRTSGFDTDTHEGLRRLALNGKWGFVDSQQKWVIPPQFGDESTFSEGAAAVSRGSRWGFIDRSGQSIMPEEFDATGDFHDGFARVKRQQSWSYVDKTGRAIGDGTFSDAADFSGGLARVQATSGLWGYINSKGDWLIEPRYFEAGDFSDGRARVRLKGYMEGRATPAHPPLEGEVPLLDDAGWFGSGLGYVCARKSLDGCALINAAGELVIPPLTARESSR
jgi:hypothetical protein